MSTIQIFDQKGNKLDNVSFSLASYKTEVHPSIFSQAIRVLLQNWRQGTVGCKTRGEVAFANRKPWRQKGTGRARVSSLRSPLWRKGGIIFGPQPRVRELSLGKEQRKDVLSALFASALTEGRIVCLDAHFTSEIPSTKQARSMLQALNVHDKKVVLFSTVDDFIVRASFGNMQQVTLASFDAVNAFTCSRQAQWVFFKKDLELFKQMVERWS